MLMVSLFVDEKRTETGENYHEKISNSAAFVSCDHDDRMPGDKTGDTPAASKTEEVNQASDELKEKLGDGYILPSEAVTKVLAKKWDVVGTESVYDLKEDGTGTLDGKALTFECGFDEDDNITMGIKMDGEEKEQLYAIEDDTTGYGLKLKSLDGGKDMELFQSDIKRIDISDAQASGLLGTWKDDNENEYTFKKDGTVVIKGSSGKTKGTFGVVKDAEGILKLNLVMEGGSLEYEYTLSEDHTVLELCSPGTDTIHRWTKA
ncbi:MAG: hypothetical protein ACLT1J_01370 [Mediterraneibacter gnavus]